MIIRYRGGPLNRRTFTGPSHQPKYRDHNGDVIPYDQGSHRVHHAARERTLTASTYVYDPQQCQYVHVDLLVAECTTQRAKIEAGSKQ